MEKVIKWFKSAGLRSVVYLAAGLAAWILLGSTLFLGIGIGIFGADNWVTIKQLIREFQDEKYREEMFSRIRNNKEE